MYLELQCYSDPELSDEVKVRCSDILKNSKSRVNAIKIEDHVHVLGQRKGRRALVDTEVEVLLREEIDIQTVDIYEKVIINGTVYQTLTSKNWCVV